VLVLASVQELAFSVGSGVCLGIHSVVGLGFYSGDSSGIGSGACSRVAYPGLVLA
jgi:hypothetical protein